MDPSSGAQGTDPGAPGSASVGQFAHTTGANQQVRRYRQRVAVDWKTVRLKPGDWACPEHGVVTEPWRALVPACRDCGRSLTLAVLNKTGKVMHVEPSPSHCAGPDRHPLEPGKALLGAKACSCSATGLHRTWTCVACKDVQEWPRHDIARARPYFGPGSR